MFLRRKFAIVPLCFVVVVGGCASPYYADRGAAVGGLGGAGVGALIGDAVGETAGGALIGAGVGAVTGAAVGGALDSVQAENRAAIASQMGRPVPQGAATVPEVVAMSRAGVDPRLITNYVSSSGMAQPVNAQDVIYMTQQGVPTDVIQATQSPPRLAQAPVYAAPPPGPVVVEEIHYGPPPYYWGPPRPHFYPPPCPPPHVGVGFTYVD
jgi:hypothetical protein